MSLVIQLAVSTVMVALTVALHIGGLALLLLLLRRHRAQGEVRASDLLHQSIAIGGAAAGLFVLHAIEIWVYAVLYLITGAIPSLEAALYFSTATYTTVGYGDVVLGQAWRVLGAIEGANGIILLGWSTAFFVAIVGRIRLLEAELTHDG